MDACSYGQFLTRDVVPCVAEDESGVFDVSDMVCTGLPLLERSHSLRSLSSSELSTSSSSDVLAGSIGLAASAASTSVDQRMQMKQTATHEDATLSASEMLETNGDEGFSCGSNRSLLSTSVDGGVFLKQTLNHEGFDSGGRSNWQAVQKNRVGAPGSSCKGRSILDESSFSQLDDLLQLDSRECLTDSGISLMDSCLPSSVGQSFPSSESDGVWAVELLQDFPCPLRASQQMPEIDEEPVENASHMFARWLQTNSNRFSLSDISKIRLKTSTIENGMKRLGGGKKGLLYFLKLLLSWIQAHHGERRYGEITGLLGKVDNAAEKEIVHLPARTEDVSLKGSQCVLAAVLEVNDNAAAEEDVYHSALRRKEERFQDLSHRDVFEPVATQYNHEGTHDVDQFGPMYRSCYPSSTVPFQTNWNPLLSLHDGWSRQTNDDGLTPLFNVSNSTSRGGTESRSSLAANVGNFGNQWNDSAATASPLQERVYLQARGISSNSGHYTSTGAPDPNTPNTTAATTRAARMSRMERRKWSVRRNRKCSQSATVTSGRFVT